MKTFKGKITLAKNNRGCYILDTVKGCSVCLKDKPNGCYDNCYAKNISSRYGIDFSNPVKRDFEKDSDQLYMFGCYDTRHISQIVSAIKTIDMPFIRIGEMGDPSEEWEHTIDVCKEISSCKKTIVIITKHWKTISKRLLKEVSKFNVCINTSISALDDEHEIEHRLNQYNILKDYCKSVLRIVSCDFNSNNYDGLRMAFIQDKLFENDNVIDTVFRPNKSNDLVLNKVINIEKVKFLKAYVMASVFNKKTYLGHCKNCPDMCGVYDAI